MDLNTDQTQNRQNTQSESNGISPRKSWKILLNIFFVIVAGALGYFSHEFINKSASDDTVTPTPVVSTQLKDNSTTSSPSIDSTDAVESYLKSPLRIIGVYQSITNNPANYDFVAHKVQLVVATERAKEDENDSQCGSIYTQPTCFFFIEPQYIVQAPKTKYLGKLEREGAFDPESVKFVNPNFVEFNTADGDGPGGFTQAWRLNIETGEFAKLKRTETVYGE